MIQIYYFLCFIIFTFLLIFLDMNISNNIQGKYYLLHSLVNFFIVISTFSDFVYVYTNFENAMSININYIPTIITYSLHFYHIIFYFNKLRFDDWLHHILMIFVALPIGCYNRGGSFLNHSLFFLTGLPGMIDYFCLFLARNNYIERLTEKKINKELNLWIRNPGCIAHTTLTVLAYNKYYDTFTYLQRYTILISALLVYWNGIYFMEQVVTDYQKNIDRLKN